MSSVSLSRPRHRLDPAVRTLWWLSGAVATLMVSAGAFIGNIFLKFPIVLPLLISLGICTISIIVPPLLYRRWRYEIRQRDVFISRGAIVWRMSLVPFDRIQYVETQQGPLERWFQLSRVNIYTAAGKAASIPGLKINEAERLREELSLVAGSESV